MTTWPLHHNHTLRQSEVMITYIAQLQIYCASTWKLEPSNIIHIDKFILYKIIILWWSQRSTSESLSYASFGQAAKTLENQLKWPFKKGLSNGMT